MKKFEFTISGNRYGVEIIKFEDNIAKIEVNGTPYKVEVHKQVPVTKTPTLVRKPIPQNGGGKIEKKTEGIYKIEAPLPGTIVSISVKPGDVITKGQKVLVMEAMKMENDIKAEKEGTVKNVLKSAGDSVLQGDVLLEIE